MTTIETFLRRNRWFVVIFSSFCAGFNASGFLKACASGEALVALFLLFIVVVNLIMALSNIKES